MPGWGPTLARPALAPSCRRRCCSTATESSLPCSATAPAQRAKLEESCFLRNVNSQLLQSLAKRVSGWRRTGDLAVSLQLPSTANQVLQLIAVHVMPPATCLYAVLHRWTGRLPPCQPSIYSRAACLQSFKLNLSRGLTRSWSGCAAHIGAYFRNSRGLPATVWPSGGSGVGTESSLSAAMSYL